MISNSQSKHLKLNLIS